jgi:hypothetical protein
MDGLDEILFEPSGDPFKDKGKLVEQLGPACPCRDMVRRDLMNLDGAIEGME